MASKHLLLIRHGRSAYVAKRGWVTRAGMEEYHRGYDAAPLIPTDMPPPGLKERVAPAELILSSDLPRAVETAQRLAPGREIETSPLFRETNLRVPIGWLPLPRNLWGFLIHLGWGFQIMHGSAGPKAEVERAKQAAAVLDARMRDYDFVVLVTHGTFRALLTYQLMQLGWIQERGRRRRHWSVWSLIR